MVRVLRCRGCGLCYTSPVYRSLLGERFYDVLYAGEGSTTSLPSPAALASMIETGFRHTDKHFLPIARRQRALVPEVTRPRVLEIGSSWGYALWAFREAGCEPLGLELGHKRRQFGETQLGLRAVADVSALAPEDQFDLVFSSHALEHFTDLSSVFPSVAGRLAPGGFACFEVPNFDLRKGKAVLPIVGAVHPLGFDATFFRTTLPKAGLELAGIWGDWEHFPDERAQRDDGTVLIVLARAKQCRVGPDPSAQGARRAGVGA